MLDQRGRRRVIALILSGIFPGLGQFYNRHLLKGVIGLVLGLALSWLAGRAAPSDPSALARPGGALLASLWRSPSRMVVVHHRRVAPQRSVTEQRGRLLMAALGFATCSMPS